MVLKVDGKKTIVTEVAAQALKATSLIAAEYSGMTVFQLTELRKVARESGVYMRVVRNTLARRAIEGTNYAPIQDKLVGPLILAFSSEDPGSAARLFRDYVKKCDKLQVKVLSLNGKVFAASDLGRVASMPTRNEAIAQLLGTMNAPVTKFVRTLAEPYAKLVRAFAAVADQKQSAA